MISSSAAAYDDLSDKLSYDPALSEKLLDEAGWAKGGDGVRQKDSKPLTLAVYESLPQPQNKAVLQLVAQQWAKGRCQAASAGRHLGQCRRRHRQSR